ncbi:SGNH hydrolase [Patellaria atrata CBS 101060]|uniref:SGNH hydrolase n=1 Tax=Patellaria atrata CBS 101060 TaxID=1346257 RepID=A0A9P4S6D2_9PEZI|nr:SGNH hydrolase [Patellaria atrata CBS 101060]
MYPQFILFGDSITQFSDVQGRGFAFAPALQEAYSRRLDVVNRGFSGYNTVQALKILPKILPPPSHTKILFMTIFFGANDAALPYPPDPDGRPLQSIPLDLYKQNLRAILTHPALLAHNPHIILITPPPVDEWQFVVLSTDGEMRRNSTTTAQYAEAVREVGEEVRKQGADVRVLDLWALMMASAGYHAPPQPQINSPLPGSRKLPQNLKLKQLLHDGLHFNGPAYSGLFSRLMELVRKEWPGDAPEAMELVLPAWDDRSKWMKGEDWDLGV